MQPVLLIADDNTTACSALALALEKRLALRVAGEAASRLALFEMVRTLRPTLLILDWELPGLCPGEDLAALRAQAPGLKILALSACAEGCDAALAAGLDAFVERLAPPETLFALLSSLLGLQNGVSKDINSADPTLHS
jgi:DNA-binding NarL/FixJ family response regulator